MVVLEAGGLRSAENWQRIVAKIYDAALDPLEWAETLRVIAASLGATGAVFGFNDLAADHGANSFQVGLDPEVVGAYATYYHRLDLWARAAQDSQGGDICIGSRLVPDQRVLLRSEFHDGFLRPLGVIDAITSIFSKEGGQLNFVSFLRPRERGCYESSDEKWFATLAPHLTRAIKIHRNMTEILSEGHAREAALEKLSFGFVILDQFARIRFSNRAARSIFEAADGISVARDRLGCASPGDDERLKMVIQQALKTSKNAGRGDSFLVSRDSGAPAYQVLVAPYRGQRVSHQCNLFGVPQGGAMVFIRDPAGASGSVVSVLRGLYGLTEAESEVAIALAQGRVLDRIADQRQVTRNTIRSQLARIYEKTDTSRQAEAVMLIQSALIMSGQEVES